VDRGFISPKLLAVYNKWLCDAQLISRKGADCQVKKRKIKRKGREEKEEEKEEREEREKCEEN
jgi:hypothetical protein